MAENCVVNGSFPSIGRCGAVLKGAYRYGLIGEKEPNSALFLNLRPVIIYFF